ncbi:MAG: BlaI/MecI/CopY family transcriptional regulator [Gemmatimonadota bacterium]
MTEHRPIVFTDRELDVMSVLWRLGSGTVAEVREEMGDVGYTTVLKILQILEEKGHVAHDAEGRAYRYRPLVAPEDAGTRALSRILNKVFHGSLDLMVARLVSDRDLTADEIQKLREIVDDLEPGTPPTDGGGEER